jgi:hypothetical protein
MSTTYSGPADGRHATMDELHELSERIAAAISRRDTSALQEILAPGFVHRTHGGEAVDSVAFLSGVSQIPGEISFVRLEALHVDECPTGALVTGIQHARVVVDGQVYDDRRGFVDWFVTIDGQWRLQAAVDLPEAG